METKIEDAVEEWRLRPVPQTMADVDEEAEWLRQTLTSIADQSKREERETEQGRAIIVMSEFVKEKGENYPLGQYLNMLLKLNENT